MENWLRRDCFKKKRRKRKSADVKNWLRRNCFAPGNGFPFLFLRGLFFSSKYHWKKGGEWGEGCFFTYFGSIFDQFALPLTVSWVGDGNFVP
jgi:hypothetical protein